ncbi:unnamed protein product, partial [Amoebophrya sp. A120]
HAYTAAALVEYEWPRLLKSFREIYLNGDGRKSDTDTIRNAKELDPRLYYYSPDHHLFYLDYEKVLQFEALAPLHASAVRSVEHGTSSAAASSHNQETSAPRSVDDEQGTTTAASSTQAPPHDPPRRRAFRCHAHEITPDVEIRVRAAVEKVVRAQYEEALFSGRGADASVGRAIDDEIETLVDDLTWRKDEYFELSPLPE